MYWSAIANQYVYGSIKAEAKVYWVWSGAEWLEPNGHKNIVLNKPTQDETLADFIARGGKIRKI
jgi:hypothetical protein